MAAMQRREIPSFYRKVIQIVRRIPRGRVATYGQIATMAGNPRAARQVAWVLNIASEKHRLPWHRVINRHGQISLPRYAGFELQRALLLRERVRFDQHDRINLARYQWCPTKRKF